MGRWCDWLVRLGAPLVPDDIRRDWLREWRAELAFIEARAAKRGRRMPGGALWRAAGAIPHAAWLRWDRWRIDMIWQDLKHSLRALRAQPGFTFVTVLTLAIGIGGTTAIFGAVNAVLLRPLPYPDARSARAGVTRPPSSSPIASAAACRRRTSPTGVATTPSSPSWRAFDSGAYRAHRQTARAEQ